MKLEQERRRANLETVKRGILGVDNRDSFKYLKIADKFIEEFNLYCRAD